LQLASGLDFLGGWAWFHISKAHVHSCQLLQN